MREAVQSLPSFNYAVTKRVIELCSKVASNSASNRMTPSSLGLVIAMLFKLQRLLISCTVQVLFWVPISLIHWYPRMPISCGI